MSTPFRICCCRGAAVVISLTALGGTTVPALADPLPPVTTTYGPVPGPPLPAYVAPPPTSSTNEGPTRGTSESPTRTTTASPTRGTSESPTSATTASPTTTTSASPTTTTSASPTTTTSASAMTTTTASAMTTTTEPPTTTTAPVTPDATESKGGWALALLLALTCAVLLSAGLLTRANRHRSVGWVKAHVTVTPRPGPGATFETRPGDEPNRDHVFTVVPAEVSRSTTVEENPS
jgi:hypothetical protein